MKRKGLFTVGLAAGLSILASMNAFAAGWQYDENGGWWWQNDDGSYLADTMTWLDGNQDGLYEFYAFDSNGYLITDCVRSEDTTINADGQWIVHGELLSWPIYETFLNPYLYDITYLNMRIDYLSQLMEELENGSFRPGQYTGTVTLKAPSVTYTTYEEADRAEDMCRWVLEEIIDIIEERGWSFKEAYTGNMLQSGNLSGPWMPYLKITLNE